MKLREAFLQLEVMEKFHRDMSETFANAHEKNSRDLWLYQMAFADCLEHVKSFRDHLMKLEDILLQLETMEIFHRDMSETFACAHEENSRDLWLYQVAFADCFGHVRGLFVEVDESEKAPVSLVA